MTNNFMRVINTTWINLDAITTLRDNSTDTDEDGVQYEVVLWFSDGADPLQLSGHDAIRVLKALGIPACVAVTEES